MARTLLRPDSLGTMQYYALTAARHTSRSHSIASLDRRNDDLWFRVRRVEGRSDAPRTKHAVLSTTSSFSRSVDEAAATASRRENAGRNAKPRGVRGASISVALWHFVTSRHLVTGFRLPLSVVSSIVCSPTDDFTYPWRPLGLLRLARPGGERSVLRRHPEGQRRRRRQVHPPPRGRVDRQPDRHPAEPRHALFLGGVRPRRRAGNDHVARRRQALHVNAGDQRGSLRADGGIHRGSAHADTREGRHALRRGGDPHAGRPERSERRPSTKYKVPSTRPSPSIAYPGSGTIIRCQIQVCRTEYDVWRQAARRTDCKGRPTSQAFPRQVAPQ